MDIKILQILEGLRSYIPISNLFDSSAGGSSESAEYCYAVWMRHFIFAVKNGLFLDIKKIAELGPGNSLGLGMAALLSGVEKYEAFDIVRHFDTEKNLKVFKELQTLFFQQTKIPNSNELSEIKPDLENYNFPSEVLTRELLKKSLDSQRLLEIESNLKSLNGSRIYYHYDWQKDEATLPGTLDMIFSQAVLEHSDNLEFTYKKMALWLRRGGFISHQIDFRSHQLSKYWNGHWTIPKWFWKNIIKGRRSFLINRCPYSEHIKLLEKNGFKIIYENKTESPNTFSRSELASEFKNLSDEDLTTSSVFLQAVKI